MKTTTNPSTTDWREEFDRKFITDDGDYNFVSNDLEGSTVKDFIESLLSRKEEESYQRGRDFQAEQDRETYTEAVRVNMARIPEETAKARKEVVEFIRGEFSKVNQGTEGDDEGIFSLHQLELEEILKEATHPKG